MKSMSAGVILTSHFAKLVCIKTSKLMMLEKLSGILERRIEYKPRPFLI